MSGFQNYRTIQSSCFKPHSLCHIVRQPQEMNKESSSKQPILTTGNDGGGGRRMWPWDSLSRVLSALLALLFWGLPVSSLGVLTVFVNILDSTILSFKWIFLISFYHLKPWGLQICVENSQAWVPPISIRQYLTFVSLAFLSIYPHFLLSFEVSDFVTSPK